MSNLATTRQMRKKQIAFNFIFPLTQKVVRNCRAVTEHVGDLHVSGYGYKDSSISTLEDGRFTCDIDFVRWNGENIKPVLEALDQMEEIMQAAEQHTAYLFEPDSMCVL